MRLDDRLTFFKELIEPSSDNAEFTECSSGVAACLALRLPICSRFTADAPHPMIVVLGFS